VEMLKEVTGEVLQDKEEKKKKIQELMVEYKLDHREEFCERIDRYEEIVMSEW
jgi:hypothetical protein